MKRFLQLTTIVVVLVIAGLLINEYVFAEPELTAREKAVLSPVYRFENLETEETMTVWDNLRIGGNIQSLALIPGDTHEAAWRFRITAYPNDHCPKDEEILILIGPNAMRIGDETYVPDGDFCITDVFSDLWIFYQKEYFEP